MRILSIETSCDETAVSLVKASGDFPEAAYEILGNALWSQIETHREYGGVMPSVGKREHVATIVPMLKQALEEAGVLEERDEPPAGESGEAASVRLNKLLEREPTLADSLIEFNTKYEQPEIDLIAVTSGPGLEPALWVGVNFAKALAHLWSVQIVPVNHMEGHILASIYDAERDDMLAEIVFPTIALLVSGGHTELLLMKNWGEYEKIGQTRDDAVGEAFDKVARLIGLPYPGGPEISKRAADARKRKLPTYVELTEPMVNSEDFDFSFSGLKTAVRYAVAGKVNAEGREGALGYKVNAEGREGALGYKVNAEGREGALGYKELSEDDVAAVARDFEDVAVASLVRKTVAAIEQHSARTLIVGGGVSGNQHLKREIEIALLEHHPDVTSYFPQAGLNTDNSIMIALAGHAHKESALSAAGASGISAEGNKQHRRIKKGEKPF